MANGFLQSGFAGTTPNFNPVPSVLTPTMSPAPVDATFQAQTAAPSLIPQEVGGFFGDLVDFLETPSVNQGLRTAGEYYLGREAIGDVQELGREQQEQAAILAERARAGTEFRPYTVTSGLGQVVTDPTGGIAVQLSPEQQALQAQLQGQAAGLFGQVGQDPAAQQAAIFEQIRATQRPEEERQRLALEERMLSQGRLGLGSAAYGGSSPELLAQETARQEAMARASLGARTQALTEQQQALAGATGLLQAGYQPQREALGLLGAATPAATFADVGRRTGTELQSQLQRTGLESRLQAENLANQLRLSQQQALLGGLLGQQPTYAQQLQAKELGIELGQASGLFGNLSGLVDDVGGFFGSIFGGGKG
jgi:hypothetical protein